MRDTKFFRQSHHQIVPRSGQLKFRCFSCYTVLVDTICSSVRNLAFSNQLNNKTFYLAGPWRAAGDLLTSSKLPYCIFVSAGIKPYKITCAHLQMTDLILFVWKFPFQVTILGFSVTWKPVINFSKLVYLGKWQISTKPVTLKW